ILDQDIRVIPRSIFSQKTDSRPMGHKIILIENEEIISGHWNKEASSIGLELKVYRTPAELLVDLDELSKDLPIFVDLNINGKHDGIKLAKTLRENGFNYIYAQ